MCYGLTPLLRRLLLLWVVLWSAWACNNLLGIDEGRLSCLHSSDCKATEVCLYQQCSFACKTDADCEDGRQCTQTDAFGPRCVSPVQIACDTDEACQAGARCSGGSCRFPCASEGDCVTGQACRAGLCLPEGSGAGGAGGEGGAGAGESCMPGRKRCSDRTPEVCSEDGQWRASRAMCANACFNGECSECVEDDRQCKDGAVRLCVEGKWKVDQVCTGVCEDQKCVDQCTEGRAQCNGDKSLQKCVDGDYVDDEECSYLCRGDRCTGECQPDTGRCDPEATNRAQSCNAEGDWNESESCGEAFCVAGACKPCKPETKRCGSSGPELCSENGEWVPEGACSDPTPECYAGACVPCAPNSKRCTSNDLEQCEDDGSAWQELERCGGETPACLEDSLTCGKCKEGDRQCDQDVVQVCSAEGAWEAATDCAATSQTCFNGDCTACSPVAGGPDKPQRRCQDENTEQICGPQGDWGQSTDCGGDKPICRDDLSFNCGCEEGDRRCAADTPEVCTNGAWVAQSACSGTLDHCLPATGQCVDCDPTDTANDETCINAVAYKCGNSGSWQSLSSCAGDDVNCGGCDVGQPCGKDGDCAADACVNKKCAECKPDTRSCVGTTPRLCSSSGSWVNQASCSGDTPLCRTDLNYVCGCNEGDKRCKTDTALEKCQNGVWVSDSTCSGTLDFCLSSQAKCVDCSPGSKQCSNNGVQTCNSNGQWGTANACAANRTCVGGVCSGVCGPGQETCSSGEAQGCTAVGMWMGLNSCAGNAINCGGCDDGEPCGQDGDCTSGHCLAGTCRPPEICNNGMDDDGNGDVDCADSACGAYACIPPAPSGWSGPAAIAVDSAGAPAPSCSGTGYGSQLLALNGSIDQGSPSCGCTCSSPASMSCGTSVNLYRGAAKVSCASLGTGTPQYVISGAACVPIDNAGEFKPVAPPWSGGSCTPQPTTSIPTPTWNTRMAMCGVSNPLTAGCSAQALCMPDLNGPLDAMCIYRSGDQACPSGAFSQRTVYHQGFTDSRSCSSCICGSSSGSCTGTVNFSYAFPDVGNCGIDFLEMAVPFGTCDTLESPVRASMGATLGAVTPQGSCPPSSVSVQGSVALNGAVTVCCMP